MNQRRLARTVAILLVGLATPAFGDADGSSAEVAAPAAARGDNGPEGAVPPIRLPADEAPHSAQMEWWYYTGRLEAESGKVYGFEVTVFQRMLARHPAYLGHFAVTDVAGDAFHSSLEYVVADQRKSAEAGFDLAIGKIAISGVSGRYRLQGGVKGDGPSLELRLEATKPAVHQYGKGWLKVDSKRPFYHYSYTRLAAKGTLTIDGSPEAVRGEAWMDHQWGTIGSRYGWDWYSLRLDDGTEVMLSRVRRGDRPGFVGGTVIDENGDFHRLDEGEFTATALGSWTSPHTKITYSHGWKLEIASIGLEVTLTPSVADQEFNHSFFGSPVYWEGLCDVTGSRAGVPIVGHAYVEITGDR